MQWLRDNLRLIATAPEIEALARSVEDNGDCYFVPAFSGLFAPYWRGDARGAIVGLTRFINRGHIARAALEAAAFQSREVIEAMEADSGVHLITLKVDGGMVRERAAHAVPGRHPRGPGRSGPARIETTALGAAYAAGLAVGFWESEDDIRANWAEGKRWEPQMSEDDREWLYDRWKQAVTRTFDWVADGEAEAVAGRQIPLTRARNSRVWAHAAGRRTAAAAARTRARRPPSGSTTRRPPRARSPSRGWP